jgi:hypothetical protein
MFKSEKMQDDTEFGRPEPPTDPLGNPVRFARERVEAAIGLVDQHCNLTAVARQLGFADRALELAESLGRRSLSIHGWRAEA